MTIKYSVYEHPGHFEDEVETVFSRGRQNNIPFLFYTHGEKYLKKKKKKKKKKKTHGEKLGNTSSHNYMFLEFQLPLAWRYQIFDCIHLKALSILLQSITSTKFRFCATEDTNCHT